MAKEQKLGANQQFGSWTIVGTEQLGKGGNGVVWEATREDGTRGAIKFLHKSHFLPPGQRFARFRDEATFLRAAGLRDGILPLLDSNFPEVPTAADRPWLVTPLAVPFSKLELKGPAMLPGLIERLVRIATTLSELHHEEKYHRDVKPDNLLELNGLPVIGDWGLVDFPGKEPVTKAVELMGPLFFIAPEMMEDAGDKSAGPADVYSLAKTMWVLASGQNYPLPGEMRADSVPLRLSTYCPHPRANILDLLLERSTRHEPDDRPTMQEFAEELKAWISPQAAPAAQLDIKELAKEYQSVFEVSNRASERQSDLLTNASGILGQFEGALHQVAFYTSSVTRIPTSEVQADLPETYHFAETFGSPSVVSRKAQQVETKTVNHPHLVRLWSFVQVEAFDNEDIRICVGHVVLYEDANTGDVYDLKHAWGAETTGTAGSASLENDIQALYCDLIENTKAGIQSFAEQVKEIQG